MLDRTNFLQSLEDAGIHLQERQVDNFYEELHRQSYPNLQDFVKKCHISIVSINEENVIPSSMILFLADADKGYVTMTSTIQEVTKSASGKSIKCDIQLADGELVEIIISRASDKGKPYASVTVSSQVGCSVECAHCPSGSYVRNLTAAEIVEQVIHASRVLQEGAPAIRKVAFMGSGEPLQNYDAVVDACRLLGCTFHLKRGRITISTIGITPRIYDLKRDLPGVILAVVLHAPTEELRNAILPCRFGLVGLFEALDNYMSTSKHEMANENHKTLSRKRRVMIEYLMGKLELAGGQY